jgi:hypothetical protein
MWLGNLHKGDTGLDGCRDKKHIKEIQGWMDAMTKNKEAGRNAVLEDMTPAYQNMEVGIGG